MQSDQPVRVSVFMAKSLDGFIARENGDVAWLHDLKPLPAGDDAGYQAFFETVDALVMGRNTFEKVLTFDDYPYGDKPVIVVSRTITTIPDELQGVVRIMSDAPRPLLDTLASEGIRHIYLDGGQLIQSFLQAGLVNQLTLTTIPVLLGKGIPLFGKLDHDLHLTHRITRTWDNGMVQSTYTVNE